MKSYLIILVLLGFVGSCSGVKRVPSLNEMDKRANYENKIKSFRVKEIVKGISFKKEERVKKNIWVHSYDLPSGDHFKGGWVQVEVLEGENWHPPLEFKRANEEDDEQGLEAHHHFIRRHSRFD